MRERTGTRVHRDAFHLTPRQEEVVGLMAKGYTNAQIADALGITLDGAKAHVSEIISRLGVATREEAVATWREASRRSWPGGLAGLGLVKVGGVTAGVMAAGLAVLATIVWWTGSDEGDTPGLVACPTYEFPEGENHVIDWAPFVNFDGRQYMRIAGTIEPQRLVTPYGRVALNVSETPPERAASTGGALECAAAFLPVGTLLYSIEGFAPTFRLATADGELYQAHSMPRRGVGADLIDIEGKVIALLARPANSTNDSMAQVIDQALVDDLVSALHTGTYNPGIHPSGQGFVLHFRLSDGSTFVASLSWRPGAVRATVNGVIVPAKLAERLATTTLIFTVESTQLQQPNLVACPEPPAGAGTQLNPAVDFVDSVTFEGITYLHRAFGESAGTVPHDAIGKPYGEVNMSLHNSPLDFDHPPPNCSAAFLPPGTILFEVIGSPTTEMIATADGRIYRVYEPE